MGNMQSTPPVTNGGESGEQSLAELLAERDAQRAAIAADAARHKREYEAAYMASEPVQQYHRTRKEYEAVGAPLLQKHEDMQTRRYIVDESITQLKNIGQDVRQLFRDQNENYAFKSKEIHAQGVLFRDLCDRVNAGMPYAAELESFRAVASQNNESVQVVAEMAAEPAERGVHTLQQMKQDFRALHSALSDESAAPGLFGTMFGGAPPPEQTGRVLAAAGDCVARSELQRAAQELEPLEQQLRQSGSAAAERIAAWRSNARRFGLAQQAIHFWGAYLTCCRFRLAEPWMVEHAP
eukprot:TRINITY_DN5496_c0_g1_i1.p1 TRINITY_DN5496_c0_g1~~TRINITY_DN5496_c0_g1_i1.p1  ORF type:complete len:323 (+),score=120.08 TRINITY_DN5496_c0_g1_i1:85-969(+)